MRYYFAIGLRHTGHPAGRYLRYPCCASLARSPTFHFRMTSSISVVRARIALPARLGSRYARRQDVWPLPIAWSLFSAPPDPGALALATILYRMDKYIKLLKCLILLTFSFLQLLSLMKLLYF